LPTLARSKLVDVTCNRTLFSECRKYFATVLAYHRDIHWQIYEYQPSLSHACVHRRYSSRPVAFPLRRPSPTHATKCHSLKKETRDRCGSFLVSTAVLIKFLRHYESARLMLVNACQRMKGVPVRLCYRARNVNERMVFLTHLVSL